jgi:hypothetical protein
MKITLKQKTFKGKCIMNPKNLVAPTVPVAATDGLITTANLKHDVAVLLKTWSYAHEQDTYQLMINGTLTGSAHCLPSPVPEVGSTLELTIAKEELVLDGTYHISYQATNVLGGTSANSDVTSIRVDRSRPGAALLAPIIFPNACFTDRLTGLIPGYAGMEQGDVIQTLCNGTPGPAHTVQADELTLRPIEIEIDFERKVMQSLAAENVYFEYLVTDRAGNPSIMSLPVLLSIKL